MNVHVHAVRRRVGWAVPAVATRQVRVLAASLGATTVVMAVLARLGERIG